MVGSYAPNAWGFGNVLEWCKDRYDKDYEICWYEGMGHSFAQITPDADVPRDRRAAADLSEQRTFEFLWRELGREP